MSRPTDAERSAWELDKYRRSTEIVAQCTADLAAALGDTIGDDKLTPAALRLARFILVHSIASGAVRRLDAIKFEVPPWVERREPLFTLELPT